MLYKHSRAPRAPTSTGGRYKGNVEVINMASWQVHFVLLPAAEPSKGKKYGIILETMEKLSKVLPKTKSWSNNIIQFGDLDSTCIEIYLDDDNEISVRIDLRNCGRKEIESILEFATENNLVIAVNTRKFDPSKENDWILDPIYEFYPPTKDSIKMIVESSAAFRFCKDPYRFFDDIK